MATTSIEWATHVWNPTTGCDRISAGCDRCYALTMAKRLKGMGAAKYQTDGDPRTSGPGFGLAVHPDTLDEPFTWGKPRRIFVNSMSDLFHDNVPDDYLADVFAVMALTPQHTYQVLTKRHGRLRSLLNNETFWYTVGRKARHLGYSIDRAANYLGDGSNVYDLAQWETRRHLTNVWLGVSVEDQRWADIRIPALLATPAAVRWVSAEPLLGPADISEWLDDECGECQGSGTKGYDEWTCQECAGSGHVPSITWVVAGGESGHGARPMHPDWARSLRDQCTAARVPYFHKQNGEWVPESLWLHHGTAPAAFLSVDGTVRPLVDGKPTAAPMSRGKDITIRRVGKKVAGRELDGRTWDEFPSAVEVASC